MSKNIDITLTHQEVLLAFYAVGEMIYDEDFDGLPAESQEALLSVRKKLGDHKIKLKKQNQAEKTSLKRQSNQGENK